ncbi:SGNH/GDSL hydrolase family protein [Planococcus salinarum]|uniref:SGNH/GDSL hydrolase family protein n=1 Tax=Planococcus salinarum TaxID=622695 RepID=UPI000E3C5D4C|nr:SGNH/GDSL hydrolase family protein [Planococcus salinarum]TAA72871.1 SGNH/GDSL hydrolase family protein [Planococcus salinarum]
MKKLSIATSIILCGVILFFSYTSWKEKLATAGLPAEPATAAAPAEETEQETAAAPDEPEDIDLERLTAEMDEQVQELFYNRKEQDERVELLIVGSQAMDDGQPGYGELLADALDSSYSGFVETERLSFDGTSEEFLMSGPQLSAGYDVVLLEPFTLKNNGRVEIETEHLHIQNVFGEVLSAESDAVLVLHPPQPIYGAQFYRTQVLALEEFAAFQGYAYIDHWQKWPSTEDLTLKDYLTEDSNPNNRGAETWANALIAYFTGS